MPRGRERCPRGGGAPHGFANGTARLRPIMLFGIGGLVMTYLPNKGGRVFGGGAFAAAAIALVACLAASGCSQQKKPPVTTRYADIGPKKNLPPYLKGSVYELTELANH